MYVCPAGERTQPRCLGFAVPLTEASHAGNGWHKWILVRVYLEGLTMKSLLVAMRSSYSHTPGTFRTAVRAASLLRVRWRPLGFSGSNMLRRIRCLGIHIGAFAFRNWAWLHKSFDKRCLGQHLWRYAKEQHEATRDSLLRSAVPTEGLVRS